MRFRRRLALSVLLSTAAWGQKAQIGAPPASDTLERGRAAYRSNCAFCHGLTGKGGRGPALTSETKVHGSTPEAISVVIREGIAGTNMPGFPGFEKEDLDALSRFVIHFSERGGGGPASGIPAGDAAKGKALYAKLTCRGCHQVANDGSVYGPNLSRIGAGRSYEYLKESIVHPSADIPKEQRGVVVIQNDGTRVAGILINEDSFSVQLRDPGQKYRSYLRSEVKEIQYPEKSMMPAYDKLKEDELNDLIGYLLTLKIDRNAGGPADKAKGIH